jgi:hypothetical protein
LIDRFAGATLQAMSYLFCSILYRTKDFDSKVLLKHLEDSSQAVEGECFSHVEVRRGLEAIFYFAGNYKTKSAEFAAACELFLLDEYGQEIKQTALELGMKKFEFYVWLSSDMSPFDLAMKFTADGFEGMAAEEAQGERVRVSPAGVEYKSEACPITPEQFGLVGGDESKLDEDAYQRAVGDWEGDYAGGALIYQNLKVTRQKVIEALHKAWDAEPIWPVEKQAKKGAKKKKPPKADDKFDFTIPAIPRWEFYKDDKPSE